MVGTSPVVTTSRLAGTITPMNIHLYSESFFPYLSGVTVSVDTMARSLSRLGHSVTVMAPSRPTDAEDFEYDVLKFPSIPAFVYPGFRISIPVSRRHKKIANTSPPDIIHSHSPFQLGWLSARHARRNDIPYVFHFHTLLTEYLHNVPLLPRTMSYRVVVEAVRRFTRLCDLVIVPTAVVKRELIHTYGVEVPVEVVPTGIDEEMVDKGDPKGVRERWGVGKGDTLLLYSGRLSKEKNIGFLLGAFRKIAQYVPNARLMIVAFGPLELELKQMAIDLGIDGRVVFTGRVSREEIYDYIKAADLFVSASKTETQGLVISESKACGIPAVAIDAKGSSDMIVDGYDGYLTEDDINDFSGKIITLIRNNDELTRLGENALKNARENYTSQAMAKKLLSLYDALIAEKRSSPSSSASPGTPGL